MDNKITKYGYRNPTTKEWLYWEYGYVTRGDDRVRFIEDIYPVSLTDALLYSSRNVIEDDFAELKRVSYVLVEGFELVQVNLTLEVLDNFEIASE